MVRENCMKKHIENECGLKELNCDECKENVLRQDMNEHIFKSCREKIGECPFRKYGCMERIKWKEMDIH